MVALLVRFSEFPRIVSEHSFYLRLCSVFKVNSSQHQKLIAFVLLGLLIMMLLGALVFSGRAFLFSRESPALQLPFSTFDLYDAEAYCGEQITEKLGSSLLRFYMDDHSSRLDPSRGIFRVYLKADVGELRDFSEITIHCFVDQWESKLNYYREFNPDVKSIKSTDIKFFVN